MAVNEESKNRRRSLFHRLFKRREILIRNGADINCWDVPAWVQAAAAGTALCLCLWGVFASGCFFKNAAVLHEKNKRIGEMAAAYQSLLGEVGALSEYVGSASAELEENRAELTRLRDLETVPQVASVRKSGALPEPEDSETLKRIDDAQSRNALLAARLDVVRGRLAALTETEKSSVQNTHKAMLQRDLAMADSEQLRAKVRKLETLVAAMQDTQVLAFRKMASVADENIGVIEDGLSGIDASLKTAGLGMGTLLGRIRRDKEKTGTGGPFIPAPMPHERNRVNISLVSLNKRLDRWYDLNALQNALPIGKPVNRIRVTSPFGAREDPFQGVPARHEAVDIGGMTGEPIFTTAPGKVIRTGRWGWYGNMVEIDHGLGFRTRYAHMDKIFVAKGDAVRTGDQIGTVGSTGRSSGPHLHYEIRVRGYAVDPMSFIKAKRNVFKD